LEPGTVGCTEYTMENKIKKKTKKKNKKTMENKIATTSMYMEHAVDQRGH